MYGAFGMRVLKIREGRVSLLLLAQGRSRGLLLRKGFRDKATVVRIKSRVNHPKMGGTSGLLPSQDKGHVLIATSLDT